MPEPMIPVGPPPLEPNVPLEVDPEIMVDIDDHQSPSLLSSQGDDSTQWVNTDPDAFDLFRQYQNTFPTYDPENMSYFGQFCDAPTFDHNDGNPDDQQPWYGGLGTLLGTANRQYVQPFLNMTTYHLMSWFYNSSSSKSLGDLDRLVNEVILADDFDRNHLQDFSAAHAAKRMDEAPASAESIPLSATDGWHETSLEIPIPCEKVKFPSEGNAPRFRVEGLHYRKFTDVVKSAYGEVPAKSFHTKPFKLFWQPDKNRPPERVISELYTADAMLHEEAKLNAASRISGCNLETVVAAIMLWSDSTHLANFGSAALWPVYMFIGNLSKYTRAKPTLFSAHHLAYIPKVSLMCVSYQ